MSAYFHDMKVSFFNKIIFQAEMNWLRPCSKPTMIHARLSKVRQPYPDPKNSHNVACLS